MKNQRAIILLFLANTISGFSQGISLIAVPWYFVDVLGQPILSAYIYFFATLLSLFWGPCAGNLVDKYSRKNIFLTANIVGATLFISGSLYAYFVGFMPIFILSSLFISTFLIFNIHYPTLYAFAQELVEPEDYGKITSYIEVQGQVTSVISGAMAAILLKGGVYNWGLFMLQIPQWQLYQIFLLDGCTYLISVFFILPIVYQSTAHRTPELGNLYSRLKTGFTFLIHQPLIFIFGVLSSSVFVTMLVSNFVLAPNYVKNYLNAGADVYAMHEILYAFGAIGAGLFISKIFRNQHYVFGTIVLHLLGGLVYFIFAAIWQVPVFVGLMFFVGLSNAGSRILRITYIMERTPNQVIGRTGSIFMVVNVLERLSLIGLFAVPLFANNIAYSFIVCGVVCWTTVLVLAVYYQKMVAVPKL